MTLFVYEGVTLKTYHDKHSMFSYYEYDNKHVKNKLKPGKLLAIYLITVV